MSASFGSPPAPTRVLILGGTSEATTLAQALAWRADIAATLSLAGRTSAPTTQPLPTRTGGFGGVDGLMAYLRAEAINLVVDATHPFAARMSHNVREAAAGARCPLVVLSRPAWTPRQGDRWCEVPDMAAAVASLGARPRRVFLTIGRLQLAAFSDAPWHHYLVRTIDPVAVHGLRHATFIAARGPFAADDEERLMHDHRIDILVTKNSGGAATAGKLEAARRLGLPVVLVRRPDQDGRAEGMSVDETIAAIEAHRADALRRLSEA